jgi:lipid-binding SYLF domain-containing protein
VAPVDRDAAAQTDAEINAEMLFWSRSRRIFGGLVLEGATLRPDHDTIKELYGRDYTNREILQGDVRPPATVDELENVLNRTSAYRTR